MIPVSTAQWDPKWFHDFKDQHHIFEDKNGVVNGIRCEKLHFPKDLYDNLKEEACNGSPCKYEPSTCAFLREYKKYLFSIDFNSLIDELEYYAREMKETLEFDEEPIIVLIVHEDDKNPCSERGPLKELFESHGIELNEFSGNQTLKEKLVLK
jgi:hypothetical protein